MQTLLRTRMIKRDLGREGEDAFSGWCNNAGFSCNPSANDKFGWDFIVEFPTERIEGTPIDSLPPPIECKVQVKSTQGDRKGEQIKVSALYRLVKYSNPAFVCFIEYGSGHYPEDAYLVHIDEALIDKVLKRVRELEKKGKGDKLHNSKITVKYTDSDRVQSLDGVGVKRKIKEFIHGGMTEYTDEKKSQLENAGKPGFKLNTTFDIEDVENFLDVSLGLKKDVKVKEVKAFSSRFNIDLPDTEKSSDDGVMLSMPNIRPTFTHKLIFKDSEYTTGVEFDADVYHSVINDHLPDDNKKTRISSDVAELISKGKTVEFSFKFEFDEMVKLSLLKKRISVVEMIRTKPKMFYELRDENNNNLYSGHLNTQNTEVQFPNDIFKVFKMVLKICNYFDVSLDDVFTNVGSIVNCEREIEQLYVHIEDNGSEFKIDTTPGQGVVIPDKFAIISAPTTMIGDYAFGLIVSFKSDILKLIFVHLPLNDTGAP